MGTYINPPTGTKEEWLKEHAVSELSLAAARTHADFEKNFLVVLMHNGAFSAAGIAFDAAERDAFLAECGTPDARPMKFYTAPKEKLLKVSTLDIYLRPGANDTI